MDLLFYFMCDSQCYTVPGQVENKPVDVEDRDKFKNRNASSNFINSMCRHGLTSFLLILLVVLICQTEANYIVVVQMKSMNGVHRSNNKILSISIYQIIVLILEIC
jgi:uncharacterized Tic20 family protein